MDRQENDPSEALPGLAFPFCSRNRLRYRVGAGLDGNDIAFPVEVLVGQSRVPRVTLISGVHGDEMEGILALQQLSRDLDPQQLHGTLVVIPAANLAALVGGGRLAPIDAVDLNRTFPGRIEGSFSERVAAAIFRLVRGSDFLYSLHSWGAKGVVTPYVEFPAGTAPAAQRSLAVARLLGFDLLRASWWHPGLLVAAAVGDGVPALEAEVGGLGISRPEDRALYVRTVKNLLRALALLHGEPAPASTVHLVRHIEVRADAGGFLIPEVVLRQEVRAGQRLGTVVDLFGDPLLHVVAPQDGLVAGYRSANALHAGDLAFTLFVPL